ncbi:polysaccharide deacetylase [Variovorax sp. LjRoot130]|uniref:polysaccharide deacetylase family protein n=1 Tax=Variovorax sp. LjRoot130 TaxID=3342261 RepID=UPI003ED0EA46
MKPPARSHWPEGKRMAFVVTVDFFDAAGILAQEPRMAGREKSLSVWQYGARRGVDRLLGVLEEFKLGASWFVPGTVALEHRATVRRIHEAGHEIGNASFGCENFDALSLAQQRDSLLSAQAVLAEVIGEAPVGFRSPFGNWAPGFTQQLRAAGIRWSSSWRGDDLPYLHPPSGDAAQALVEIPLHYELEDEPYFAFNLYPPVPVGQPRIASYCEVLGNWQQDFAGFRRFGLCLPLRLHPEIIGTAGRIDLLREFLAGVLAHDDVWVATGRDVAAWWSSRHTGNEAGHPVDVFSPLHEASVAP